MHIILVTFTHLRNEFSIITRQLKFNIISEEMKYWSNTVNGNLKTKGV